MTQAPSSKKPRAEDRVVVCFPERGPRFEVRVAPSASAPDRHLLTALQDAVATREGVRPGQVRVFLRHPDGTTGAELTDDFLPPAQQSGVMDVSFALSQSAPPADPQQPPSKETREPRVDASPDAPAARDVRAAVLVPPDPANGVALGTLKLPSGLRWQTHVQDVDADTCFIRPVYEKMYDCIAAARAETSPPKNHVLFIGNPGIGKSWALNYFLFRALKETDPGLVMLRTTEDQYFAYLPDGSLVKLSAWPGDDWIAKYRSSPRVLVFYDVGTSGESKLANITGNNVCIVVASSPNKANYKWFVKNRQPRHFYVPTWSREEFLARFAGTSRAEAAGKEYDTFGGVLRDAFDGNRSLVLHGALRSFDFSRATAETLSASDTHSIVKLEPIADNTYFKLAFHTPYIEDEFWAMGTAALDDHALNRMAANLASPARELYGKPFESYVHRVARSLNFAKATVLSANSQPVASAEFAAVTQLLPADFVQRVADDSALVRTVSAAIGGKKHPRWVVPAAKNYPVFDAFLVVRQRVYGVQVTISDSHPADAGAIKRLEKHFVARGMPADASRQAIDGIIWVVDSVKSDGVLAREQAIDGDAAWRTLPQFRILVSCMEHVQQG